MSKLKPKEGRLYVVSTPIGNYNDITIRALNVLREADLVLCENFKEAAALLKYFGLEKELDSITIKSESDRYPEFILMIEEGKTIALISDCGTPAFADPGNELINSAISRNLDVQVLPGATSIMTALVRCGFDIERFYFAGFLSRTSPERVAELRKLSINDDTFCLLETPYRLLPLLEDAVQVIPNRRAYLACNLTMKNETHHYGTVQELYDKFKDKKVKMEFVFCVEGNTSGLPLEKIKYIERSSDSSYSYSERKQEKRDDKRDFRASDKSDYRKDRPQYKKDDGSRERRPSEGKKFSDRPRRDDAKKLPRRKDELGRSKIQRKSRDSGEKTESEIKKFAGWRSDKTRKIDTKLDKEKNDNEDKD